MVFNQCNGRRFNLLLRIIEQGLQEVQEKTEGISVLWVIARLKGSELVELAFDLCFCFVVDAPIGDAVRSGRR